MLEYHNNPLIINTQERQSLNSLIIILDDHTLKIEPFNILILLLIPQTIFIDDRISSISMIESNFLNINSKSFSGTICFNIKNEGIIIYNAKEYNLYVTSIENCEIKNQKEISEALGTFKVRIESDGGKAITSKYNYVIDWNLKILTEKSASVHEFEFSKDNEVFIFDERTAVSLSKLKLKNIKPQIHINVIKNCSEHEDGGGRIFKASVATDDGLFSSSSLIKSGEESYPNYFDKEGMRVYVYSIKNTEYESKIASDTTIIDGTNILPDMGDAYWQKLLKSDVIVRNKETKRVLRSNSQINSDDIQHLCVKGNGISSIINLQGCIKIQDLFKGLITSSSGITLKLRFQSDMNFTPLVKVVVLNVQDSFDPSKYENDILNVKYRIQNKGEDLNWPDITFNDIKTLSSYIYFEVILYISDTGSGNNKFSIEYSYCMISNKKKKNKKKDLSEYTKYTTIPGHCIIYRDTTMFYYIGKKITKDEVEKKCLNLMIKLSELGIKDDSIQIYFSKLMNRESPLFEFLFGLTRGGDTDFGNIVKIFVANNNTASKLDHINLGKILASVKPREFLIDILRVLNKHKSLNFGILLREICTETGMQEIVNLINEISSINDPSMVTALRFSIILKVLSTYEKNKMLLNLKEMIDLFNVDQEARLALKSCLLLEIHNLESLHEYHKYKLEFLRQDIKIEIDKGIVGQINTKKYFQNTS